MPRFVILRHETAPGADRTSHWDVMLEHGAALSTWACDSLPGPDGMVDAVKLADHRLAYLDYQGPVSGNRGSVARWDEGEYEVTGQSSDLWSVQLQGKQLCGCLKLTLRDADNNRWDASFVAEGT